VFIAAEVIICNRTFPNSLHVSRAGSCAQEVGNEPPRNNLLFAVKTIDGRSDPFF
jgi:hypothetical protein